MLFSASGGEYYRHVVLFLLRVDVFFMSFSFKKDSLDPLSFYAFTLLKLAGRAGALGAQIDRKQMPPRNAKPLRRTASKVIRQRQIPPKEVYVKACVESRISPNSGMLALLSQYSSCALIERLDVNCNYLGDKGALPVFAVVERCQNLKELNLSENGLRNNAIRALCTVATKHPAIETINISDNYISEGAAVHLHALLEDNPRICCLVIDNTKIDVKWRIKLRDLACTNTESRDRMLEEKQAPQ
uniref:Leucine-rich repeat protein (LRRP) n=1 Tax=Trypanosoma congolense (strain IL3000) TaxID=1068625 RepID=G0UU49_TRYCI|nr:conserved hypothetical protein [Trypanosoma congolense IL3000]